MKNYFLFCIYLLIMQGCYNPEDNVTLSRITELSVQSSMDSIFADGFTFYQVEARIPGIRFGNSRKVTFETNWGSWENGSSTVERAISYNESVDSYVDTLLLRASREVKEFTISVSDTTSLLGSLDLRAFPNYPSEVQVLSDSTSLRLIPSNTTRLRALFFSEIGFPSDGIVFRFQADSSVTLFPKEVLIDSSRASATLQISTDSMLDTIAVHGILRDIGQNELNIDTLKIAIIN